MNDGIAYLFETSSEQLKQAKALRAAGDLGGALDLLIKAVEGVIDETSDEIEELIGKWDDLDGRVG